MLRFLWWCCPRCELLCPVWQTRCGACSVEQTNDVAQLSFGETADFQRDAAIFNKQPPRK